MTLTRMPSSMICTICGVSVRGVSIREHPPAVDRQMPVKILPCPKLHLRVVKMYWILYMTSGFMYTWSIHVTHSLRFISGVTPADLFAASMAAEPFSSTYLWVGIGGSRNLDLCAATTSGCETRQTLYRLSYAGSAKEIGIWKNYFLSNLNSIVFS